jgi:alpha-D-xyloside xylohydrolase
MTTPTTHELEPFLGAPQPVELVSRVLEHRLEGSSLILRCATERHAPLLQDYYGTRVETVFTEPVPGREATVRIDACSPDVLRLRCAPGEVPAGDTPMVVGDVAPRAAVRVHAEEATVRLETASLTCIVHREPFALELRDRAGETILRTRPVDLEAFRRPEERWNPPEQRWLFLVRYAYPLGWTQHGDRTAAFASFELHHEEAVYGLGESFGPVDKRGTSQRLWLQETFSNSSPAAYKQCPFLLSTRGYGIFANTSNALAVNVGSRDHTATSLVVEDTTALDLFVIHGPSVREILPRYTAITGAPALPPRWSFGLWMGRITYRSQEEVERVARELRAHRIPCDVIHIDTGWFEDDYVCDLEFSRERFPDPAGMCERLRAQGFRVCLWQWPNYNVGSPLFDAGLEAGFLARRTSGHTYTFAGGYGEDAGLVDWSNPAAVEALGPRFAALFDAGVAAIKVDYGEGAPPDAVYHDVPATAMHNRYPLLYARAIWEMTERARGPEDTVLWARAAWAGSQRYPVHWSGDGVARFEDLACVLRAALSFGLSGFPFYSHDIGGFSGLPSPELYVRWAQFGLFSSHARAHGSPPREPWAYGERAERIVRAYAELRYRLLPYLYSQAIDCCARSLPMVRPLVVEFQDDPVTHGIEDQYLLGDALLVAPVLDERTRRRVYLPPGGWFDLERRERLEGRRFIDVDAPLERLPLFAREGRVLALGEVAQHTGDADLDPLRLELYGLPEVGAQTVHGAGGERVELAFDVGGDGRLAVRVDGAPGRVELAVFGLEVTGAAVEDRPVAIEREGTAGTVIALDAGQRRALLEVTLEVTRRVGSVPT